MISMNLWTIFTFILPLASASGGVHYANHGSRSQCTVLANGGTTNDVPNILKAFSKCGNGGDIIFPEGQNYYIASKLNPVVNDVNINWGGIWTVSHILQWLRGKIGTDRALVFPWHRVLETKQLYLSDRVPEPCCFVHSDWWSYTYQWIWHRRYPWQWRCLVSLNPSKTSEILLILKRYTAEAGHTLPGRPMPFVLWNVSDVTVKKFFIIDPPLWSFNIMNGTDVWVDELYTNATATKANASQNWVQNTDGFGKHRWGLICRTFGWCFKDTMDSRSIRLTNFVYQGNEFSSSWW